MQPDYRQAAYALSPRALYSSETDVLHVYLEDVPGLHVRRSSHLTEIVSAADRTTTVGFIVFGARSLVAKREVHDWASVGTIVHDALATCEGPVARTISTRICEVVKQDVYIRPCKLASC